MKKNIKILTTIILLLAVIYIIPIKVEANTCPNLFGGIYDKGCTNIKWYIDSTASSYTTQLKAAANN